MLRSKNSETSVEGSVQERRVTENLRDCFESIEVVPTEGWDRESSKLVASLVLIAKVR